MRRAAVPLLDLNGAIRGELRVLLLPHQDGSAQPPILLDIGEEAARNSTEARVQLLEGEEYRFEVSIPGDTRLRLEPREVITLDSDEGRAGRLRPGLNTGQLLFEVLEGERLIARAELEVRSRKLEYRQHYRWMLRDIADAAAELIMERFAASSRWFVPESDRAALTLYQRFEFVSSILEDEAFQSAIRRILSRPYVSWQDEPVEVPLSSGLPAAPRLHRMLSRPGPRVETPHHKLRAMPLKLSAPRSVAQQDTPPNQFVRYVLMHWRDITARVEEILRSQAHSSAVARGVRRANALRDQLDAWLGEELFRDVGPLRRVPTENQVLQKREGYRDLFRAFVQTEVAAQLSWMSAPEGYQAGQRTVATLYEYWVFFQLGKVLGDICGRDFTLAPLIQTSRTGFTIDLTRGKEVVLRGEATRNGRRLQVELWFNRTFTRARGSWTGPMRPDCSVRLSPADSEAAPFEPVWLHFDAKYRLDEALPLFGRDAAYLDMSTDVLESGGKEGAAKVVDLLKMHAYRDAIKRSAGAYVVYPGTEPSDFREYQELLPGLGAFPLTPTVSGSARGATAIRSFMEAAVTHTAEQLTQHERARYWLARSYAKDRPPLSGSPPVPGLRRPPADTDVLVGYVRSTAHLRWIVEQRLYNMRTGKRRGAVALNAHELSAELLFLYGPPLKLNIQCWRIAGRPRLLTRGAMLESGYQDPRGALYLCLPLGKRIAIPPPNMQWTDIASVVATLRPDQAAGAPVVISLAEFWQVIGVAG